MEKFTNIIEQNYHNQVKSLLKSELGDWYDRLEKNLLINDLSNLSIFLTEEREKYTIYPKSSDVFNAFKYTQFKDLKVVIIGQDPYHDGSAIGLAFGVNSNKIPPSLRNIKKEWENSNNKQDNFDYSLKSWASQGVLLLNTALTVKENSPGSHTKHWQFFTEAVIKTINEATVGTIFLLWGKHAQTYKHLINPVFHEVLEAGHPSPLNTSNPFVGCDHFNKTNNIINNQNGKDYEINW